MPDIVQKDKKSTIHKVQPILKQSPNQKIPPHKGFISP